LRFVDNLAIVARRSRSLGRIPGVIATNVETLVFVAAVMIGAVILEAVFGGGSQ
jgi:hypothetical protein